jgi:hypothetical protein
MDFEFVGIGPVKINDVDGWWCATYMKAPAEENGGIPDLHHHLFPASIFAARAEQYGLDIDNDWDKVFDLVMHDPFAGNDEPSDNVEPSKTKVRMSQGKHNVLSHKMERRAERAKREHNITGLDAAKRKLSEHRTRGIEGLATRVARLEAARQVRGGEPDGASDGGT